MKNITFLISIIMSSISMQSFAQDHTHHAKHNMVLFGEADTYFASHIVYKVPHNFQVILKIKFDKNIEEIYLKEKASHPDDEFIFLLDQMDIKEITTAKSISGVITRTDQTGTKIEIASGINIESSQFKVIYFDELPLSLSDSAPPN